MRCRHYCAFGSVAAMLSACARESAEPRAATNEEAAAIIAPIIPRSTSRRICVGTKLRPLIDDEPPRHDEKTVLQHAREFLEGLLFGGDRQPPSRWQSNSGKFLALRSKDAARLDQLFREATRARLTVGQSMLKLPKGVKACDKQDESTDPFSSSPAFRYYFSQPVIVGNIAFVDKTGVCGGLCGAGSTQVLVKRSDAWAPLAELMTWVA